MANDNTRVCKKCGAELPADYEYDKCDNCRRETAGFWRKITISVSSLLAGVFFLKLNKLKNSVHNDEEDTQYKDELF